MGACVSLATTLSRDEARAVIEPFFEAARELFLEAGLDRCCDTRLVVSSSMHDTPRHFAACRDDGKLIYVAPEMVELPDSFVVAIMAHEFGHATDFLYPGEFALKGREVSRLSADSLGAKEWSRVLKAWQATHAGEDDAAMDRVELTADAIAERVFGAPIGYSGPCRLQTFDGGVPRPRGLR